MLKKIYQGVRILSDVSVSASAYQAFWMSSVEAMLVLNTSISKEVKRVFRDGSSVHIAVDTATPVYDQAPDFGGVVQHSNAYTASYQLDARTWIPDFSKPFVSEIGGATKTVISAGGGLFLINRSGAIKYYQRSGQGYKRYDSVTGALEATTTVFTSGTSPIRSLQWLENQTVVFTRNDGSLKVYDLSTDTTLLSSTIDAPTRVAVDTKYKNIVAIRASDLTTQVYDIAVQPTTFSALSATPGTYLRYYKEDLSITVLGADGDVAAGVDVVWGLKAIVPVDGAVDAGVVDGAALGGGVTYTDPLGKITPKVSTTDANGVATATYCPPGNDWVSGVQEVITAKVFT